MLLIQNMEYLKHLINKGLWKNAALSTFILSWAINLMIRAAKCKKENRNDLAKKSNSISNHWTVKNMELFFTSLIQWSFLKVPFVVESWYKATHACQSRSHSFLVVWGIFTFRYFSLPCNVLALFSIVLHFYCYGLATFIHHFRSFSSGLSISLAEPGRPSLCNVSNMPHKCMFIITCHGGPTRMTRQNPSCGTQNRSVTESSNGSFRLYALREVADYSWFRSCRGFQERALQNPKALPPSKRLKGATNDMLAQEHWSFIYIISGRTRKHLGLGHDSILKIKSVWKSDKDKTGLILFATSWFCEPQFHVGVTWQGNFL